MAWVGRGVLVGALAGVIAGLLALGIAEPSLERAIALEQLHASGAGHADPGADRDLQRSALPFATGLWGGALGLLISLAYRAVRPRMRTPRDATAALLLTGSLFLAVVVVPFVKYAPDPPGAADPETAGRRTVLWLTMVAIALVAVLAAGRLSPLLARRLSIAGALAQPLAWAAVFGVTVVAAGALMPSARGAPEGYPADLLWEFRLSSFAVQAALWGCLALGFGVLADRRQAVARA